MRRIIAWLNPEANSRQGQLSVPSGLICNRIRWIFRERSREQYPKLSAIPEAQNDMILTVICEELGVFGAILILCLFGFMLYRLMFIARNAPDLLWISDRSGHLFAYCSAGDLKYCSRDRSDPLPQELHFHLSVTEVQQSSSFLAEMGDCTWDLIKNRIKRLKPLSGSLKKYQRRCLLGAGSVSDILNKRL